VTRKPLFWTLLAVLAVAGGGFALRYYGEAFPLLAVDVEMSREDALEAAELLAQIARWAPAERRQAASFRQTDPEVQTYVELEGGGAEAFASLVEIGPYRPYVWEVRHFAEGEVAETRVRFTPEGRPYGFREILPEELSRPNLTADSARALAEQQARTRWAVEPLSYRPIEASQETRPGGRTDHTFVYELDEPGLADAAVRLRLVVAGNSLSELTHFVYVPDAFVRRYQEMRSANDTIALLSTLVFMVGFFGIGCGLGVFILLRRGWIVWRPAVRWALLIAVLLSLGSLNQVPLAWMGYDTALSRSLFLMQQIGLAITIVVFGTPMLALVFLAAESLGRAAFPHHPQQWRLWSRDSARSDPVLGRTAGAYLWAAVDLGFVVAFYLLASRLPGWWMPSETMVDPDLLSTPFPWLMAVSLSAFAGFWEESLFRAVPIAGAKLLGDRFGGTRVWIGTALVVQALVFAAAHANYPQQPSYARVVELFLPALLWGVFYLLFGLLPVILIHFLHNFTFFSIFLFSASAPGLWLDRTISLALMLTPLAIVVAKRLRHGRLLELPDALRNAAWQPPERALQATSPGGVSDVGNAPDASAAYPSVTAAGSRSLEQALEPHAPGDAPPVTPTEPDGTLLGRLTSPRALTVVGVVGALIWLLVPTGPADAPSLSASKAEAVATARSALESGGASTAGYEGLATVAGSPDASARFVWETSGSEAYRELLGTYLPPPRWQVRFARFSGPIEERAEEWRVTIGPEGAPYQMAHDLPEERPGAVLAEEEARALVRPRVEQAVGDGQSLREISAEARQRPARRDWLFTYVVEGGPQLAQGELRVAAEVAGDEVVAVGRLVYVPEAWEREERSRATRETIAQLGSAGILGLLLLAASVTAVVVWSRGVFAASVFSSVVVVVAGVLALSAGNGFPAALASFSTAQPLRTQMLTFGISMLVSVLSAAGGLGLLAGLAHTWLWRPPTVTLTRAVGAGVAAGLAALGVTAAAQIIAPSTDTPSWPGYAAADALAPTLGPALSLVLSLIAGTTALLLVFAAVYRFRSADRLRRTDVAFVWLGLGMLLGGVAADLRGDPGRAALEWLVVGGLLAVGLALIYALARRIHPAIVPIFAATLLAEDAIEAIVSRPYPGALLGGGLALVLLAVTATIWARGLLEKPVTLR
jgi:hypothetical protein